MIDLERLLLAVGVVVVVLLVFFLMTRLLPDPDEDRHSCPACGAVHNVYSTGTEKQAAYRARRVK